VAYNYNCLIETEGLLNATVSDVYIVKVVIGLRPKIQPLLLHTNHDTGSTSNDLERFLRPFTFCRPFQISGGYI